MDNAGFIAPMVMPGVYTIKLKVGDKEYTEKLTLVHDEANKNFTAEDRKVQYQTATELYRLHHKLYDVVENINAKQAALKLDAARLKDTTARAVLRAYERELEDFRGTLLASKQKSIFADEVQLRERITEVYGAVATQEARPSNLQLERVKVLNKEFALAEKKHKEITAKFDAQVQSALAKEGLNKEGKTF
jgi:hypothetical protein